MQNKLHGLWNIFATYIKVEGLSSTIYKQLLKINKKDTNKLRVDKGFEMEIPKEGNMNNQ